MSYSLNFFTHSSYFDKNGYTSDTGTRRTQKLTTKKNFAKL